MTISDEIIIGDFAPDGKVSVSLEDSLFAHLCPLQFDSESQFYILVFLCLDTQILFVSLFSAQDKKFMYPQFGWEKTRSGVFFRGEYAADFQIVDGKRDVHCEHKYGFSIVAKQSSMGMHVISVKKQLKTLNQHVFTLIILNN